MLTLSFVLMSLTVGVNVLVHGLNSQDRKDVAASIDRACRWVFPTIYAYGMIVLAQVYLL